MERARGGDMTLVHPVVAKDLLERIPYSRELYAATMRLRARWSAARGRELDALHARLRGWRALEPSHSRERGVRNVRRLVRSRCHRAGSPLPVADNRLLAQFRETDEADAIRCEFGRFPVDDRVRLRKPRANDDPERQGDLMVLKEHDAGTGEKGVLLLSYTQAFRRFAALFDVGALARRYVLVLEPSWWGYADVTFLMFVGADLDVVVQAPWRPDFDFIRGLDCNLRPIRIGAGDWVDPAVFEPREGRDRTYDPVMVSAWSPVKRHRELFRALARIKRRGRSALRVALIRSRSAPTLSKRMTPMS